MSGATIDPVDDGASCTEVDRPSDLLALVGQNLGSSSWLEITQAGVDAFARVTRDEQWIHVDRERAAAGPFGTTIAHGYFVLSLCAYFTGQVVKVTSAGASVNYGLDKVRFMSPVPVGSRLRAQVRLASAVALDNRVRVKLAVTIASAGHEKPACVAEMIALVYDY
jgi:acyl dehydratase